MREPMDPRLIRVVARHFDDLQGLRTTAWMLWMVAVFWMQQVLLPRGGWLRLSWFVLVGAYTPLVGDPLRRYYARRVGRVAGRGFPPLELRWGVWLLAAGPILAGGRPYAALSLAWLAYPIYLVASGWPYRKQHLLTVAVAAGVAAIRLVSGAAWPVPDADIADPLMVVVLTLAVTGLFDHALLVRILRPSRDAEAADCV